MEVVISESLLIQGQNTGVGIHTLTQEKKTITATTLLNWSCRLARGSNVGWVVWFSSRVFSRRLTVAVLVIFMMMAATLSWQKRRPHKWTIHNSLAMNTEYRNISQQLCFLTSYVSMCGYVQWRSRRPDSSTGSGSNAGGGCGSPAPPPPRSRGWRGRRWPRIGPQSSPSWIHIGSDAPSGTARTSARRQSLGTPPTTWQTWLELLVVPACLFWTPSGMLLGKYINYSCGYEG